MVEVTRLVGPHVKSTFFGRFKQLEIFLKKVAERSRDSGQTAILFADRPYNVFWTFHAIWEKFEKSRNGHATVVEVTRPFDCQTTFFGRFKQLEKFWKKVAERSRDSGRRSRDRRPTVKQRFLDVSSNLRKFEKKSLNDHATVCGGHATVGRLSNNVFWTCDLGVVGGHATVGRLSNNVFWTFQAIRKFFEKSR